MAGDDSCERRVTGGGQRERYSITYSTRLILKRRGSLLTSIANCMYMAKVSTTSTIKDCISPTGRVLLLVSVSSTSVRTAWEVGAWAMHSPPEEQIPSTTKPPLPANHHLANCQLLLIKQPVSGLTKPGFMAKSRTCPFTVYVLP